MNKDAEKRIAAQLAKAMAMICVSNSMLEDLHAGPGLVTRTGDYSDVLDADGNRIPWSEVSRIDDAEMRDLMRQIVNRLYTFHLSCDEPALRSEIDRWMTVAGKWDEPDQLASCRLVQTGIRRVGDILFHHRGVDRDPLEVIAFHQLGALGGLDCLG